MSLDLLFGLFILFFAIVGYLRGFLNQLLSVALIVTVILFAQPLAELVKYEWKWSLFQSTPDFVMWSIVAFVIFLGFVGLYHLARYMKKAPGMSPLDHWLGFGLGLVKGIVLVLIAGAVYTSLPEDYREQFPETNQMARNSTFIALSEKIRSWESISTFDRLNEIRHRLRPSEREPLFFDPEEFDSSPSEKPEAARRSPWLK
jgi:uncharacterized membrane protein required for colicin V production